MRPGRENGGTTLMFRLSRAALLRVTIVRVFPSCKRIGSFRVKAHKGMNRIRFRGRFRGRALPVGGYRLVIRARGAERDAAAIPIVIARGRTSKAAIQRALGGSTCSEPVADVGLVSAAGFEDDAPSGGSGGRLDRVKEPVAGAAGAVAGTARNLIEGTARAVRSVEEKPLDDPMVLTVIGVFLVIICLLATMLLAQIVRARNALGGR